MRRNLFRLYDKVMGRYLEVAAMMHGRDYGFKYIYCFPPEGVKLLNRSGGELVLSELCGGTIGYKMTDIDRENIILEQWAGKGWVKVMPICRTYEERKEARKWKGEEITLGNIHENPELLGDTKVTNKEDA